MKSAGLKDDQNEAGELKSFTQKFKDFNWVGFKIS